MQPRRRLPPLIHNYSCKHSQHAVDTRIDKMERSPSGSSSQDTNNLRCECYNRNVRGGDPEEESSWKRRSPMSVLRRPQTPRLNPLHILFHFHCLGNLRRYWWLCFMKTHKGKYLTSCSKQSVRESMDWCCPHFRHILPPQVTHQKIPHRHAWRLVSWAILGPVKLTILIVTFIPILKSSVSQARMWLSPRLSSKEQRKFARVGNGEKINQKKKNEVKKGNRVTHRKTASKQRNPWLRGRLMKTFLAKCYL